MSCAAIFITRRWPARASGSVEIFEREIDMTRNMSVVLYIVVLIAVVVSVDVLFFKNRVWERLIVNIGIVLVFAAFYLRFLKNP
jgi:protein-S-isoprenylcysteine O-methyltransferase Ste14